MKIRLFIHILLVLFMIIYILLLFHSMMQKKHRSKDEQPSVEAALFLYRF